MSTGVAAKAALIATMETALTGENCPVVWGLPDWEPDDVVVVQGASGTLAHAAMGSTRPRDESYSLVATVSVYRGCTDQRLVTERAWALFDLIEAAVRARLTKTGRTTCWARWRCLMAGDRRWPGSSIASRATTRRRTGAASCGYTTPAPVSYSHGWISSRSGARWWCQATA